MYGLRNSFKKISEEIQIPFKLVDKDGAILADFLSQENIKTISCSIKIPTEELTLETYENYSNCIALLKCFLEQELGNTVKSKEEIIVDILKGKEFSDDILKEVIKYKPFKLILVYLNEKQLKKGLEIIKNNPLEDDSIIVTQDEYILIISKNEISKEKINELFKLISKNITKKVYMTYCNIHEYKELKERFEYLKGNIGICIKYELASKVYGENSLLLEKMINNASDEEITRAYKQYNNIFSKLDNELIKTIEVFLGEGLKISESAEKLYIHRNTLFYRIDKIKKIINYDISNFNEALEFKILFLLWKEAINSSRL
ncbi:MULTISPECIES: PucR family transcriptional regulator [unclassified Clostridium]|uniref:PucR family transcriptional regulator n=1 Tax=unclassified Clostridium TaxID=2614128 RepID=UPI002906AE45|nr:helix-turn-helix domain-containing protein [Clostridium sp.]MDU5105833.1 helix-turn-helix domain-containing protein [Clostridium sp.]